MNPSQPPSPAPSAGRRRLLRAAPALTVLPATPVLAANCKLPSGFSVSGHLSRAGGQGCSAPAPQPRAWASLTHEQGGKFHYNGTTLPTDLPFSSLFPGGTSEPLATVLAAGNANENALFAAVRLQAIALGGAASFPAEAEVLRMWNETRGGTYSPTPGVSWGRDEVRRYLRYLTGQSLT